jgi:hypothetical protein
MPVADIKEDRQQDRGRSHKDLSQGGGRAWMGVLMGRPKRHQREIKADAPRAT